MINAVRCDRPEFKTVEFERGFNVILAERTVESTEKDSRNGLGKTTLIEIIHFCLGSTLRKDDTLSQESLRGWTFSIDIEVRKHLYTISRNTENSRTVIIQTDDDWKTWPVQPDIDPLSNRITLSVRKLNLLLGWLIFDLPIPSRDDVYLPTFRSLISYFVRKGRDAFSNPFEHHRRQSSWDSKVNSAFLLGLNWEHARKWQLLRDRENNLNDLRKLASSGSELIAHLVGTRGELDVQRTRLEEQVARSRQQLQDFRVHPQYEEIEQKANSLTVLIHSLTNENIRDRRLIEFFQSSMQDEQAATLQLVVEMYNEIGLVLPDAVVKRLEEVQAFHEHITTNRQEFLQSEIRNLLNDTANRTKEMRGYTEERAKLLQILETHGALSEYSQLQRRHAEVVARLEEVKQRLENLRKFEQEKSALKIEREQLLLDALADHEERKAIRQRAISLFNANSEALYEAPGNLIVDINQNGFAFHVEIERQTSEGIKQIGQVFTYDLTLAELWAGSDYGPGFLVHDSAIFDGVDERQIALALQLAADRAKEAGFQYICCLNSDQIPWSDFDQDFDLSANVRLTLTDASDEGGLLGIRF